VSHAVALTNQSRLIQMQLQSMDAHFGTMYGHVYVEVTLNNHQPTKRSSKED
jgi:hypothetical protein